MIRWLYGDCRWGQNTHSYRYSLHIHWTHEAAGCTGIEKNENHINYEENFFHSSTQFSYLDSIWQQHKEQLLNTKLKVKVWLIMLLLFALDKRGKVNWKSGRQQFKAYLKRVFEIWEENSIWSTRRFWNPKDTMPECGKCQPSEPKWQREKKESSTTTQRLKATMIWR